MSYFDERAVMLGKYIALTGATVRRTADEFGIAKSTVHKTVTERLPHVDASLAAYPRRRGHPQKVPFKELNGGS